MNNSIDYYTIRKNEIKEIFDFEQKFLEDVKESCIERMKKNIKLKLRNHIVFHKFQDKINKEFLFDNDYYFSYQISQFIVFNVVFYLKDKDKFTYQISDIKFDASESLFKLSSEQVY